MLGIHKPVPTQWSLHSSGERGRQRQRERERGRERERERASLREGA